MTAALLEGRIREAVEAALAGALAGAARPPVVRGAWAEASGAGRGPELRPVGAYVYVSAGPAAYASPGLNRAEFPCALEAGFRSASGAAAAATVLPACGALEALLLRWTLDAAALAADLGRGGLRPFALRQEAGEAPAYDEAAGEWRAAFRLTVLAVVTGGGESEGE